MKKEIKDYLHLYLGCEIICTEGNSDLEYEGMTLKISPLLLDKFCNGKWKPILRPLSDMTKKENKELADIIGMETDKETYIWTPDQFVWLLSNVFDIFGLIKAGLAINKTTLLTGEL